MADTHANDHLIDKKTGMATTGHEWDGLRELNTPLPRWWLWLFYICVAFSVGYWLVYPSWPLITSYTTGFVGTHSREWFADDIAAAAAAKGELNAKLAATPVTEIAANADLNAFATASGKVVFMNNCAACHGTGAQGGPGYANLNDDDWLWGGSTEQIVQTIAHGIRWAEAPETRMGNMPAFGRDGVLTADQIKTVANYALTLSGGTPEEGVDLAAGKQLFTENCAACHGEDGKGIRDVGAPNLTDAIWLYGSDIETIKVGLQNGRGAVMPAWSPRLDEASIKAVAIYVHGLGGGE